MIFQRLYKLYNFINLLLNNKVFDYLQKFNQLPKNLRDKVSTSLVMAAIDELEKKYNVSLASLVMRVMIKEVRLPDLAGYFIEKENLDPGKSEELAKIMAEKIFTGVKDYLGAEAGGGEKKPEALRQTFSGSASLADLADKRGGEEKPAKVEAKREATPAVEGASFFFSSEDEEEIRELTKKINGEFKVSLTDEEIEDKLNKIITSSQINFGSQELLDRFRSILKTYLRGIRDRIETKQTLKKIFSDGGLGFDDNSADEVLKITDSLAGGKEISLRPPLKIRLPEDRMAGKEMEEKTGALKNIGMRDVDYSFSSLAAPKEKKEDVSGPPVNLPTEEKVREEPIKLDISHEISPPPPMVIKKPPVVDRIKVVKPSRPEVKIPGKDDVFLKTPEPEKPAAKAPSRTPTPIISAGKRKMEDVKYIPPKVMNPIDELRYMDLINFRRLSPEAEKQIAKIREKINLLEEENYSRRIEGVRGWRQSPVNRLYLSLGQQSISERKPVDAIIEERKNTGQDYLTLEEFKAIMDLNKELRF
ncbi:MAG: hypothetical protein PHR36_01585 [Patescibacteria group bacterium]|nr:hypothetical protein [Patescibacteria group bacterium]